VAPLPTIANVYRVALNWTESNSGSTATNVMHFRKSGTNPGEVAGIIDDAVTTNMWEQANVHAHVAQLVVTPLDGGTVSLEVNTGSPSKWSGPAGDAGVVPQVAALVKFVTLHRGRSYRGRVYLPFVSENQLDNGKIVSAGMAEWQDAWQDFSEAISGEGLDLVVASYLLETAADVVGILCERDTATQRRRWKRTSA